MAALAMTDDDEIIGDFLALVSVPESLRELRAPVTPVRSGRTEWFDMSYVDSGAFDDDSSCELLLPMVSEFRFPAPSSQHGTDGQSTCGEGMNDEDALSFSLAVLPDSGLRVDPAFGVRLADFLAEYIALGRHGYGGKPDLVYTDFVSDGLVRQYCDDAPVAHFKWLQKACFKFWTLVVASAAFAGQIAGDRARPSARAILALAVGAWASARPPESLRSSWPRSGSSTAAYPIWSPTLASSLPEPKKKRKKMKKKKKNNICSECTSSNGSDGDGKASDLAVNASRKDMAADERVSSAVPAAHFAAECGRPLCSFLLHPLYVKKVLAFLRDADRHQLMKTVVYFMFLSK